MIIVQHIMHNNDISQIKKKYLSLIDEERKNAVKKSKDVTRGNIAQEFVTLLPDFPYNMSDCKFSGQPIDFLVFDGMSNLRDGNEADVEIVFADVKTNTSRNNKIQNAIKKAIENKRVRWETWNILEDKQIKIINNEKSNNKISK